MIHCGQLYDVELGYYNHGLAQDHFDMHPPCKQRLVIPLDTRLLKMLVFLFEAEKMHDPPGHAVYDDTVEEGPQGTEWLWDDGPAVIVWDNGLNASYWERLLLSRRTIITITQREAPSEPWFSIKAETAVRNRYPVTCKSRKCMKVLTVLPTNVHLHATGLIQPEILDTVEEMLSEMLADTAPALVRRPPVPPTAQSVPGSQPGDGLSPPHPTPPGHGGRDRGRD